MEEFFDIVDEQGNVVGAAPRKECHGNPALIHRAVHVLVFNEEGELFLQKRSPLKDIQPGKWDTSVGGHLARGEDYETAALREMEEELGITGAEPQYLYSYPHRDSVEAENVQTYSLLHSGVPCPNPDEIVEGRFWSLKEIHDNLGKGMFTPNFEEEFRRYLRWRDRP